MATAYQTLADTERAVSDQLLAQAHAADEWEGYRNPHATRIVAVADALAQSFHLAPQDRAALRLAALAHDFGILAMRRDYIRRSGPLSLEEQLDLARHPIIGEQEAARLGTPRAVQLIVRWHHEAWNGMGYPDMLQREQIPLAARILRVADSYVALTDHRPYRPARTERDALRLLIEGAGLEFDPMVVQALVALGDLTELRSHARPAPPAPETPVLAAATAWQPHSLPLPQPAPEPETVSSAAHSPEPSPPATTPTDRTPPPNTAPTADSVSVPPPIAAPFLWTPPAASNWPEANAPVQTPENALPETKESTTLPTRPDAPTEDFWK